MKHFKYFLLVVVVLCISCEHNSDNNEFTLISTNEKIEFQIPNNVSSITTCLQYYRTDNGKQYLSYLSGNKLLFYNIDSLVLSYTLQMPRNGPKGVGRITGFFIHNPDTIILTNRRGRTLYIVDQSGNLKKKIPISRDIMNGEYGIYVRYPSYHEKTIIIAEHNIFVGTHLLDHPGPHDLHKYKLCLQMNLVNDQQKLLPMTYPPLGNKNNEPVYNMFSTLFVADEFIYSFMNSHNLYKTKDHKITITIPAKSRYIEKDFKLPDFSSGSFQIIAETVLERPAYLNFYYDKYRNVFYRFVYPGIEIEKSENISDLLEYKPFFSIMILDAELRVIGEVLMPKNKYNLKMAFVGKEGLYISTNHTGNPDFSADYLRFEMFKLEKKQD